MEPKTNLELLNDLVTDDYKEYNSININNNYKNNNKAIFICLDNNCIFGLIMTIQSIIKTNEVNSYIFNILCDYESYNITKKVLNTLFSNINFNIKKFDFSMLVPMNNYIINSCKINSRCRNNMNYSRFFYEKYFEEDYYLYIDTDIIVKHDLNIYFENLENCYIRTVLNMDLRSAVEPSEIKTKYLTETYKVDFTDKGFNAGMYTINNKKAKEENHLDEIIKFMNTEYRSFKLGTQPIVNIFYYNKISDIGDLTWNYCNLRRLKDYKSILNNLKSIHFKGNGKPWEVNDKFYNMFLEVIFSNEYFNTESF